jgi:hypothetical protein
MRGTSVAIRARAERTTDLAVCRSSAVRRSLMTADVSPVKVFEELKNHSPHLVQPYSTVRRLVLRVQR